jgi:hypothetical protein
MASSKAKAKCSSPRFYGYLDSLRGEFDLLTDELISMKKKKEELEATSIRFSLYLKLSTYDSTFYFRSQITNSGTRSYATVRIANSKALLPAF